jgi:hypothetical protein
MAEERTFLHENSVYVSNTRVIIRGTTYATANVTSVRTLTTPAKTGCAALLIAFGALGVFGAVMMLIGDHSSGDAAAPLVMCAIMLAIGILWYRSLKPMYHVMLATAGGERQGLTSQDWELVSRTTAAIADAIVYRG